MVKWPFWEVGDWFCEKKPLVLELLELREKVQMQSRTLLLPSMKQNTSNNDEKISDLLLHKTTNDFRAN